MMLQPDAMSCNVYLLHLFRLENNNWSPGLESDKEEASKGGSQAQGCHWEQESEGCKGSGEELVATVSTCTACARQKTCECSKTETLALLLTLPCLQLTS